MAIQEAQREQRGEVAVPTRGKFSLSCHHKRGHSCWRNGVDTEAVDQSSLEAMKHMEYLSWTVLR